MVMKTRKKKKKKKKRLKEEKKEKRKKRGRRESRDVNHPPSILRVCCCSLRVDILENSLQSAIRISLSVTTFAQGPFANQ